MKKQTKVIIGILIVLVVAVALGFNSRFNSGVNTNKAANQEEIVIGAVLSETGMASIDGNNIKSGIEFAKEELLKKGVKVKVVYEDDGTEPKRTVTAIQKLVDVDHPQALIGPTWSFLADSGAPIIERNKLVTISPANTSEFVGGKASYMFFGAPKNAAKEVNTTEWIKENNLKNIAIVIEKSGWGESHITPFQNAIDNSGAKLAFIERFTFSQGQNDASLMRTIIAKAKSAGVDGILYTGFDQSTAVLIKTKQDMKADFKMLMATEIPIGLQKQGVIHVSKADNLFVLSPKESKDFNEAYKARYGNYPGAYADRGYDSLMLLVDAIQHKGTVDLKDYLKADNGLKYKGYAGVYSFDQNGDVKDSSWRVVEME